MTDETLKLLSNPATRADTIILICRTHMETLLPQVVETLEQLSPEEAAAVTPYLHLLGPAAVGPLRDLLQRTEHEPAIQAALGALGQIGVPAAIETLLEYMRKHFGDPYAAMARDALIHAGRPAVPGLVEALDAPEEQVRYYAVQALALIGEAAAVDPLLYVAGQDADDRVREAAIEALQLIPTVGQDEFYCIQRGLINPMLASEIYMPEWRVDVVNADKTALRWRFDREVLEGQAGSCTLPILRALLRGYKRAFKGDLVFDVIVLLGDARESEDTKNYFGMALGGISRENHSDDEIGAFLMLIDDEMRTLPGYQGPEDYWLGMTPLIPVLHLERGAIVEYDQDDSHASDETRTDENRWYGSFFEVHFAKGVMDQAWVYRRNLRKMKEMGEFQHMPVVESEA